jgi:hypothetical protein
LQGADPAQSKGGKEVTDVISRKDAVAVADARLNDVPESVDREADRNLFAAGYLAAAGSIKSALERLSAPTSDGITIIAAERRRHFQVEDWTPEHDDDHVHGEMAIAAACYAVLHTDASVKYPDDNPEGSGWPWGAEWFKPKDEIHNLARAGALMAAEIDRLKRSTSTMSTAPAPQPVLDAGEWRVGEQGNALGPLDPIYPIVDAQTGKAVALAANPKDAAQIVSDHRSAATVPNLVQALKEARALIGSTDELARLISQAPVLKLIDEALTTVQGKEQG